jgi:hypothetical protein
MLIINNRFLSVYDYNFLLFYEKIFSVKPAVDEKLKEKQMNLRSTKWFSLLGIYSVLSLSADD